MRILVQLSLVVVYRLLLDWFYVATIVETWSEYRQVEPSFTRGFESYAVVVVLGLVLRQHPKCASDFFFSIFSLLLVIPMTSIYFLGMPYRAYFYLATLAVLIILVITRLPVVRIPVPVHGPAIVYLVSVAATVSTLVWLVYSGGWETILGFEYGSLYESREFVTESSYTGLWAYTINWSYKLFTPLLIAVCIHRRVWTLALLLVGVQISYFFLTTHKFPIAVALAVLSTYYLFRFRSPVAVLTLGFISLVLASSIAYFAFENATVASVLGQRPLYKPSMLNFVYYEFFRENPLIYLSNSFPGLIALPPYDMPPAYVVGEYFKGAPPPSSNTGFLGTGYGHFGVAGVLTFAVLVGLIMRLYDSISIGLPVWMATAIGISPFMSMLVTADFFPSLLTQGVSLLLLVVWLLGRGSVSSTMRHFRAARMVTFSSFQ